MLRPHEDMTMDQLLADPEMEEVLVELRHQLAKARFKHAPFANPREAHSVIEEEFIEMRDEIFADRTSAAMAEALHLAAMAIRFVVDLQKRPETWVENRKRQVDT